MTEKARRRITFEALDSGPPGVASAGNLGDVWVALLLRGETPRHSRLIHNRRALSVIIVVFRLIFVKIFLGIFVLFLLLLRARVL